MKRTISVRLLSAFLLWTALRSVYFVYLGEGDGDYRLANDNGFGPAVWIGEMLYAFLATGAVVAIWLRWKHVLTLALAALAVYTSVMFFQLQQMESNPIKAREAYAASRRARGLPVNNENLDALFSESGRHFAWALGAAFTLGPLAIVWWRRADLMPSDME
jgi:hypothetical protein